MPTPFVILCACAFCSNFYFQILVAGNSTWAPALGPGGKYQWSSPASPGTMMLTSDVGLLRDPRGIYPPLVQMWVGWGGGDGWID